MMDQQVNSFTADRQYNPAIAVLADGGWIVVWQSFPQDGKGSGVYGQRFDATGNATGEEFQINQFVINQQSHPTVAALDDGGFVVSWRSRGQDFNADEVYARRYDGDGVAVTDEARVNTVIAQNQSAPETVALEDGGWVTIWESLDQDGSGKGVFGQRYSADGQKVAEEFKVNTTTEGDQADYSIAALEDGGFVVSWTSSDGQDGSRAGVYAQVFGEDGQSLGGEFQVNTFAQGNQQHSSVTGLSDGGFIVTWESPGVDGSVTGIAAQRYDAAGVPVGEEFVVNSTARNGQRDPVVTALEGGGFVVVWRSAASGSRQENIVAQIFDADGDALGEEIDVNSYTTGRQLEPTVDATADGGFVVVWTSRDQDGDQEGVFQKRFDATGTEVPPGTSTNQAPDAVADNYVVKSGEDLTFNPIENDSDPDGDDFSLTDLRPVDDFPHRLVSADDGEGFVFTALDGFSGTAEFEYTIVDEHGAEDSATITIEVDGGGANGAPDTNDDFYEIAANRAFRFNPFENDEDPDGDALELVDFSLNEGFAGRLLSIGNGREFLYIPDAGFAGEVSFDYTVSDGRGGIGTSTVTLQVGEEDNDDENEDENNNENNEDKGGKGDVVSSADEGTGAAGSKASEMKAVSDTEGADDSFDFVPTVAAGISGQDDTGSSMTEGDMSDNAASDTLYEIAVEAVDIVADAVPDMASLLDNQPRSLFDQDDYSVL